jgi:hypothetical protein
VAAQIGRPVPPPGVPGPFSLGDAGRLEALLRESGLAVDSVGEHDVPLRADSFETWWTRTCALAGPLAAILDALPEPAVRALRERLREATAPYRTAAGLELPGLSLVAAARRPAAA